MAIIKKFRITHFKNQDALISLKNISLSFQKKHLILDNISLNISNKCRLKCTVNNRIVFNITYSLV